MSIETLLTLVVAAAILVLAAVLRFVVLGSIRMALRISGVQVEWLQKPAPGTSDKRERARVAPSVARGLRSAAAAVGYIGRAFVEGLRIGAAGIARGAAGIARGAVAFAAWLSPWMRDASRSSTRTVASAGRRVGPVVRQASRRSVLAVRSVRDRLKPSFVVAVATVQHLARLILERARSWIQEHEAERSARPGEPTSAGGGPRVIDLDRDFDPLTDEFPEDRIGSSV